jgi:threonine dehydratase
LIAGVATAIKSLRPGVRIIGVQSENVNSCFRSFKTGHIEESPTGETIADGIAVRKCGRLAFSVIRRLVDDMVVVGDDAIVHAVVALLEWSKLVVEPAGAVGLAAMLAGNLLLPGKRVVIVLSGGNIDPSLLARLIEHGLTAAGRYLIVRARLLDRPGQLMRLVSILAQERVNIMDIEHHRAGVPMAINQAEVELTLEVRDPKHCAQIMEALQGAGFEVWREW